MSKSNPRKALDALVPRPVILPALGVEVRPLTLASHAILDKIRSPMLTGDESAGPLDLVPTLYAVTRDPTQCLDELADGTFARKAVEWADTLPPTALPVIKDAILAQIRAMTDVIPGDAQKKTAGTTDGSRPSPNGPAAPTAGPGTRPSSRSRRRSSRSSGVKAATPTETPT